MTGTSGRITRAGGERVARRTDETSAQKKKGFAKRFASRDDDAHSFLARGVETATEEGRASRASLNT